MPDEGPRIAIDLRMLRSSGIGTYLRNVVPRVIASWSNAHFTLLGRPAEMATVPGLLGAVRTTARVFTAPIYSVSEQFLLPLAVPRDTDLLWVPHYNLPLLYRGRMVATIYDVAPLAMSHLLSLPKRMYARAMFAYVRRRASALLTISEFTRSELLRLVGVPRGTISVIPLAAGDEWRGISAGPRPDPAPYLVYVGNVKPQKNLVALLSAFASLLDRIPHRLVIVGRERGFITGDPRVQQMARQLGDRVLLTGEVDDETLRGWVAHADALVFPSLYEGFGLPPLEAMAIGTPAVVSHAASLPEVCGDAALYFDPHDPSDIARQIECVVGNHAIADRLRRAGRQRVSQSSWSDCAARTTAVLQAVLRGGVR